jgi:hypothetical protein
MIKELLNNEKFYKQIGTKQLKNLAKSLRIKINDIKYCTKYRRKIKKRILENLS